MKNGYTSLTEISNALNMNGYKTRNGCLFRPEIVKRVISGGNKEILLESNLKV